MATTTGASSASRLSNDTRRVVISTLSGVVVSLVVSTSFTLSAVLGERRPVLSLSTTASVLSLAIVMFALYQLLTWIAFARLSGPRLREVVLATNPRSEADRLRDLLIGNGPKSWSVVAATIAMIAVLAVIIDETLRSSTAMIILALVCVALSWVMISFAFAVSYLRYHAEHPDDLVFPGARGTPPVWRDYVYLAFQVSATFSSSDVELTSTKIRGQVTAQTIIAFTFNSVIVALLVSALGAISS